MDSVLFGRFPQDEDGKFAPLEWLVLEEQGAKMLLLSKYVLKGDSYNKIDPEMSIFERERQCAVWADSKLREWLNGEFIKRAFKPEEREAILKTYLTNPGGRGYTENGYFYDVADMPSTEDQVFLLTVQDVKHYLPQPQMMQARPTEYAKTGDGCYVPRLKAADGCCAWFLRSCGYLKEYVASVKAVGGIDEYGASGMYLGGIRPAIWIDRTLLK